MAARDWVEWHREYDQQGSRLSRRLAAVQRHVAGAVSACPPGEITLISACAGQGRDVVGALVDHPRRDDVRGRLVELDERNADYASALIATTGLPRIEVVRADAGTTSAYAGFVPADVILLCGIFGNVPLDDIANTAAYAPMLCVPGGFVIWTRHPGDPTVIPQIDGWFVAAGFERVAIEVDTDLRYGIGVHRLAGPPRDYDPEMRLFAFAD